MDNLSFSTPNILVVDDVIANLVILSEIIRNEGYIPRPVTNVNQAINAIEALSPSLILLDISMPDIDGFVFCAMLKKNANTRDIPVIFISAHNNTEDRIKGLQLGAVDYIAKPFDIEEVTLRINTHLKMYKTKQELEIYNKKLYKIINDQIRKIYEEQKNVIIALTKICTTKDPSIAIHLERVGKNSRMLAMSLQLSAKRREGITNSFVDTIEIAAYIHDLGKIALADSIVYNIDYINAEEKEIMKTHTTIGANILESLSSSNEHNEFIKMAADIARYHHENWDGSGYPTGLSGTAIPLSARIVSIIDAYDLLINSQQSKPSLSHERSMDIINKGSGILFDPDLVTVFGKIQNQLKR